MDPLVNYTQLGGWMMDVLVDLSFQTFGLFVDRALLLT
jgi:hypothetical protein